MFHGVPRCPTESHGVPRCPTVSHVVPRCPTLSHGVPRCPTMSNGVQRCPTVQSSVDHPKFFSRHLEIYTEPMVSHVAVQCRSSKILFAFFGDLHWTNGVPRCPTVSHGVPRCPTMSNGVPRCPTVSHDVQRCPTVQPSLDHPKFCSRHLEIQTGLVRSS